MRDVNMTTKNNFRTAARALSNYISDSHFLLLAADAVVAALPEMIPPVPSDSKGLTYTKDRLVEVCRDSIFILNNAQDRKILAIKHLRALTGVALRDAKDAVEDCRVQDDSRNFTNPPL